MTTPRIRHAEERDLPVLVRIYNHFVTASHVTFDTESLTVDQRRPWLAGFADSGAHQLLVVHLESQVVGYASSTRHRPKSGYDRSVETTIYLDPAFVGRGIGRLLYGSLLEKMRFEAKVHRAFGGIALPNPASVALHEGLGFECIGTFHQIGFKFNRYWDVRWFEKDLSGTTPTE